MNDPRKYALMGALAAVGAVWACDPQAAPTGPESVDALAPAFHVGCPEGTKFTGGGRIDPGGQKVTFGFNVHADDACGAIKGQLQVVHHPTKTKYHSTAITRFSSFPSPEGGVCGEWEGTVRVKHGNGGWHPHSFFVEACDNGEPGSSPGTGPDTFRVRVGGSGDGHGDTGRTPLTGGNIQAH